MTESNHQPPQSEIDSIIALFSNNMLQEALDEVKSLTKRFPKDSLLHNITGACYAGLGQLGSAIKCYDKAIDINPDYAKAHFNLGNAYHEQGELDESITSYQRSIEIDPNYAEAHNNLGNVFRDYRNLDEAIDSFKKAISISPEYIEAHYSLALTFQEYGQLKNALDAYQKAIEINSEYPALYNNLGNVFKELGLLDKAISSYKNALTLNPIFPESLNNLGSAYRELGQLDDALKSLRKVIQIEPDYVDAYYNLAITLNDLKKTDEAIKNYKKTIHLNPDFVEAHNNLGNLYTNCKQFSEAINSFKRAIKINPNYAEAYNNLGNVYEDCKQFYKSVECYEKAIKLKPNYAEAHNNLGSSYKELNQLDDALKSFKKAIKIKSNFAEAHNNLGNILKDQGRLNDALKSYKNAKKINDSLENILGNIISAKMNSCNWNGLSDLFDELVNKINNYETVIDPFSLYGLIDDPALHRKACEIRINNYQPKNDSLPKINKYLGHPKIRLGYFSPDFREHPVGYLTAQLYELHNRNQFEIHAFSFGPDTKDAMNLRIKAGVDHFHDVQNMSDVEIAVLARSLEIDIAVDLAGHTANSKTEVFALSAAPIQVIYLTLGTMGAEYYDYLIAGKKMIPENNHKYFLEKIVYLPNYLVNDSKELLPKNTLTRSEVGLPEEGFVFCCFNNTFKITPQIFDSWARVLKAVEGSVLIIYAKNNLSKNNLNIEISLRGISPNRLIFADSVPRTEYLLRYHVADLFLDTRPFNAGTTASDALKMGLPVLTCKGNSFSSMEGAGIISALNLPELITNSPEEYEALAIELATNPEKLKAIKDKLKSNLSSAPLFDTPLFTKNIESAYTKMYERYHEGLEPDHIYVE